MSDEEALIAAAVAARESASWLKSAAADAVADAVSKAMDGGVSRVKLAAALGVSIPRVYQLRDKR